MTTLQKCLVVLLVATIATLACVDFPKAKADAPRWYTHIGRVDGDWSTAEVYTFQRDGLTCFMVERYHGTSISCVK